MKEFWSNGVAVGFVGAVGILVAAFLTVTFWPTNAPVPQPTPTPFSTAVPQPTATMVVFQRGTLVVSIDTAGAARDYIGTPELRGVEMLRVKLCATAEDVNVKGLVLGTLNGSGNIASVKLLGTGLPVDPSVLLVAGKAVFVYASGSEVVVPAYGCRVLTAVVDTTSIGTATAGQVVMLGVLDIDAIGAGSGVDIQEEMTGILVGNPMRMEEVEPIITRHPSSPSGQQIPSADQVVAVFQVTASEFRNLMYNGLTIEKEGSNNPERNVTRFSLWNESTKLAEIEGANSLSVRFAIAEQVITAGSSTLLMVRADTTAVRHGAASGTKVTFGVRVPGTPGLFGEGGFSWDYIPLNTLGTAAYKTQGDSYPVQGGVLEY